MKDFNGKEQEFEKGKLVICEMPFDDMTPSLTHHKAYEIQDVRADEGRLVLTGDNGKEIWVNSSRFLYHPYEVTLPEDAPVITTIDELLHEIAYSWDYATYPYTLHRAEDGLFHVNKLTVGPYWTEYKGHYSKVLPELYQALCRIYAVIEEARRVYGQPKKFNHDSEVEE